ncbi:signal peptidase II [Halomonas ventosae]|uniref:Lipoprotein signal peptidase n=1 Tax=Halomonas ventosae TaxID=229007 RepID=A0A4R6ZH48_9GAMM|nr:signal peptidase II [Halomonas ventosae]TDR51611.1 signal peptidase II [Halomonas ventosae]
MSEGSEASMSDKTGRPEATPMDRPLRWLWLALAVIVLDLGTKYLASGLLDYARPVEVLPFFNLTLLHNTGAAFSFLAGHPGWQRWFFATIAVGASIGLTVWMRRLRRDETLLAVSLALIIGGALGNLYDRLVHGYVVDFLSFHVAGWYYPAFNVADIGITLGAIGLIWESLFAERRRARRRG